VCRMSAVELKNFPYCGASAPLGREVMDRPIGTSHRSNFTVCGNRSNSSARASRMVVSMTSAAPGRS
jgi:hypothetical protein